MNARLSKYHILGAFVEIIFSLLLWLFADGRLGVQKVPLIILMTGPLLPIIVPFILLALKKREMAIGALVVATVIIIVSFLLPSL